MGAPTAIASIGLGQGLAGTALSVSSYNSAGKAGVSASQYNSKLIDLNLNRQLDSLALELRSFNSKQTAQIAKSGVSVHSKSSLIVMNEALSRFEKEAVLAKENAHLQQQQELFAAQQHQEALRTQSISSGLQGVAQLGFGLTSLFSSLSG